MNEKHLDPLFDLENEDALAQNVPTPFCLRAKRRAILLADFLLSDEGKITRIDEALNLLQLSGEKAWLSDYDVGAVLKHFIRVLNSLKNDPSLRQQIHGFGLPLASRDLEEMIKAMLGHEGELSERDVIWAVLSTLLCPLRQSVGSCFATAPAILIHEEMPHLLLADLQSLLFTGELKRVVAGDEFSVPLSPSPGIGDLKRAFDADHPGYIAALEAVGANEADEGERFLDRLETSLLSLHTLTSRDIYLHTARGASPKWETIEAMKHSLRTAKNHFVAQTEHLLLKMWEYTLASLADVKTEFSRWNLYSSLGLQSDEPGGIGSIIYRTLELKLQETNEALGQAQADFEIAYDQVRATEHLLRNVSTESEGRRLRAEHQARVYHMHACENMRDALTKESHEVANFYQFIIDKLIEEFPRHFQEIYDAEMHEVAGTIYDDSPAGFRLLYKHGRTHTGSWTFITTKDEYIEALKAFFVSAEQELGHACEWEGGHAILPHLITEIIHHLSSEEFLVTAFQRMAKAHKVPLKTFSLDQIDRIEKKPWAYTSGGTIPTLLKTYFRRESFLTTEERWVEDAQDLAVFLIDTLKSLPPNVLEPFRQDPRRRMLMTSPTHAFSLLPGQPFFSEGWDDPGFTYTWVRDQIIHPRRSFYRKIRLTPQNQYTIIRELAHRLPPLIGHDTQRAFYPKSEKVRIETFYRAVLKILPPLAIPQFDAILYEMLPFSPHPRRQTHDQMTSTAHDPHQQIELDMCQNHTAPPPPLVFADSNWAKFDFAFVVHPASGELELWRIDRIGLTGLPMREWTPYITGSSRQPWTLYTHPYQYSL